MRLLLLRRWRRCRRALPIGCGVISCCRSTRYGVPFLRSDAGCHGPHERGVWQRPSEPFGEHAHGAFNSAFNSSWNASGINPAFVPVFPELADDSYATIGLSGPASTSGLAGAADPSIVEDATQAITPYFLTPGATNLESTTLTGASWYVLNTAANGLPDASGRVLVMQVTTTGSISGQMNYQVFPLGVGADQVQVSVEFDGAGTFGEGGGGNACGCTNPSAVNYDASAEYDDGSCILDVLGCDDATACNTRRRCHSGRRLLLAKRRMRCVWWRWHPSWRLRLRWQPA